MSEIKLNQTTHRRGFLGMLAAGAATVGLTSLLPGRVLAQDKPAAKSDVESWFNKIKGSHRVVYDAPRAHEIFPFAWPKVFLMTNAATGTPASDCGVVVVLRHDAIGYAFQDNVWAKYKFGDLFKLHELGGAFQAADAATATKTRNPFWNTKPDDFKVPGIGAVPIGIKDLQSEGVLFCVCNAAMTVYSTVVAGQMNLKPEDVKKEWEAALIPGIQVVPSGVWALGRAQEHKCSYIFAG